MSGTKPGFFRRILSGIGKLFSVVRWTINLVLLLFVALFLFSIFGKDVQPLPDHAPLVLTPSGILVEERSYADPITQLMEQSSPYDAETPVRDLTAALRAGKDDPRVTGLVLDLNHLAGGGISKLAEVGSAIADFRTSGKPVIAISDSYTQEQYYLASHADDVLLNPMGGVVITGFGYYGTFFKNAADKLKINFHVFRAGEFKTAIEPFTRNQMSDEARDNTLVWINALWRRYTSDVEKLRELNSGSIDSFVNDMPARLAQHRGNMASLALGADLVDRVASRPQIDASLAERFGADENGFLHIPHKSYLAHIRQAKADSAGGNEDGNVGVIVASGVILDGDHGEGRIGGDSLSRLLRMAGSDPSLKALVLRLDSPGGSAFASELIRQEILRLQEKMPVVVSMGSVAASGGYWIAAPANEIWAQPTSITGSIGVFGIIPTFEDSLAALGITSDGVGTTRYADFSQLDRPLSEGAAAVIQLNVDNIYRQFLTLVADSRRMSTDEVDAIARGRVWTGEQAADIGLVDKLGDLNGAIASAATMAGVDAANVKFISRPLSFQEQLMKQLVEGQAQLWQAFSPGDHGISSAVRHHAGPWLRYLDMLKQLNDPRDTYLQCFSCGS
ncbi:MAG: signal peptide peptidase SppA [Porticoccaceae bacterium]|nr:signal peptide peptidase SppA [Porticoccaceae bacterium]